MGRLKKSGNHHFQWTKVKSKKKQTANVKKRTIGNHWSQQNNDNLIDGCNNVSHNVVDFFISFFFRFPTVVRNQEANVSWLV